MFKINDKTLYNEEVELYGVTTIVKDEKVEDTYNIFIGAKDEDDTFTIDLYTQVPRKVFYKLPFQKKVLINEYLDAYDVSIALNSNHSIESTNNAFICFTRIGKTLFKLDMVIPKIEKNDLIKYVEIHTHIDLYKDVYETE